MNNGISLGKIIGGLSKTLNIANQVIPLCKQAKPLINKSASFISSITKNFNNSYTPSSNRNITSNKPTFFQ